MKKFEKIDVYKKVTEKILSQLENNIIPWQRPWTNIHSHPRNIITGHRYSGINQFLLNNTTFKSPFWGTYKQIRELGGQVRKGERSELVVYWKMLKVIDEKTGKEKTIPMLKHFNVFNVRQCDGLKINKHQLDYQRLVELTEKNKNEIQPLELAENIILNFKDKPKIEHSGTQAFYNPKIDFIRIPERKTFLSTTGYYSTLFHELSHSTGHKSRLDRGEEKQACFGSHEYSKEELVAEISASFLLNTCGLEMEFNNNSAYIKSWLKVLKNDKKFFFEAASKAQKSADYILNIQKQQNEDVDNIEK